MLDKTESPLNKLILLRDELADTGGKELPLSYFWSPDIVVHDLMEDPVGFLSWSYLHDVSQPLPPQGGNTLVYIRAKNISSSVKTTYIHVYAITPELFETPSAWLSHKLKTEDGNDHAVAANIAPGGFGVTDKPFNLCVGKGECPILLAIASDSAEEPAAKLKDFTDPADFAYWVRENTCVSLRIPETRSTEFQLDGTGVWSFRLHSPEQVRNLVFHIDINGAFPAGSRFVCSSPFFDTQSFSTESGGTKKEIVGKEVHPGTYGVVKTKYEIKKGEEIQGEAMIRVTAGIRTDAGFLPVSASAMKYLQGAGSGHSVVRSLDLRNEDDRNLLQQQFVTSRDLQKYPTLRRYITDTIQNGNDAIAELAVNQGNKPENRMSTYTMDDGQTVSYITSVDLEDAPDCAVVKAEAIDTVTGEQVGMNIVSVAEAQKTEVRVDIPKDHNPQEVRLNTTLIAVRNRLFQGVMCSERLNGNGAVQTYELKDPSRKSGANHKYVNVSIENRSTCWQGQGESDYTYNIKSHYEPSTNRNSVPFFLPMKGSLTFKKEFGLYPAVPEVSLCAMSKDGNSNTAIKVYYQDMDRNKVQWKFEGDKVSWEFLEDWGDFVPFNNIQCSNYLKLEASFNFRTAMGFIRVYITSGENPGLTGNYITMEYIDWCWGCLAHGTSIRMADGSEKNIEDIRPGDCLKGLSTPSVRVEGVTDKKTDTIVVIRTSGGSTLRLTHMHPVETKRGMIPAGELNAADLIRMESGAWEELDWLLTDTAEYKVYELQTGAADSIFANGIVTGGRDMEKVGKPKEPDAETSVLLQEFRELAESLSRKQQTEN